MQQSRGNHSISPAPCAASANWVASTRTRCDKRSAEDADHVAYNQILPQNPLSIVSPDTLPCHLTQRRAPQAELANPWPQKQSKIEVPFNGSSRTDMWLHCCRAFTTGSVAGCSSSVPAQQQGWRLSVTTGVRSRQNAKAAHPGPQASSDRTVRPLVEIVRAEPHITLKELAGALKETHGVSVQLSSIHRALVRSGLSYEKRPDRAGACAGCYQAGAS